MKSTLLLALTLTWATACTTTDTVDLGRGDGGRFDTAPDRAELPPDSGPFTGGPDGAEFGFDVGSPPGDCGGITGTVCPDGAACTFSGDCNVGSICNTSDDPYFDPDFAANVCMRLVCARDEDCRGGRVCSVERVCGVPTCVSDDQCASTELCSGGQCILRPTDVVSCEVVSHDAFVSFGRGMRLEARALSAAGRVVGGVPFGWSSSVPARVTVVGDVASGGTELGASELRASMSVATATATVFCAGVVRIENVTPGLSPSVQVQVVAAESGAPLPGARVIIFADGAQQELTTDAAGAAVFPPISGALAWVTVLSTGREHVSVMAPGTRDVLIPVGLAPTPQRAGGFRGAVDVAATPSGDLYVGVAGAALPRDLSRFRLSMLLGDRIDTVINAPQLGLTDQPLSLAGNLTLRLGNERFTVDRNGPDLRCQGLDPGPQELGCYVARAPAGPTVAWTLSTRLKLQDVASIAGRLSRALADGAAPDPLVVLPEMMPLLRTAPSGVNASLTLTEVPRVDVVSGQPSTVCSDPDTPADDTRCRADYARYTPVVLRAEVRRTAHTVVEVPRLPSADGHPAEAVLVMAAAVAPAGLVPLGITGGRDSETAPDGLVESLDKPFGPFSDSLPAGQLGLSSAVPHSGLEGLPLRVVAVAYDQAVHSATGSRVAGLVTQPAALGGQLDFGTRGFLGYPAGVLDRSAATFAGTVPAGATTLRIELIRGGHAWRIYAPPTTTTLTLPAVMEARVDLLAGGTAPEVNLQAIRTRGSARHIEIFTRGSGVSLDTLPEITEAFSAQRCVELATGLCRVQ